MQSLQHILSNIQPKQIIGNTAVSVSGLSMDSREIKSDYLFMAISGTQVDGHAYIDQAIEKGASVIVCEQMPTNPMVNVTYVQVTHAAMTAGEMAAAFYGYPSRQLKITGVTGTNGKTTCATLLFKLFRLLGYSCGLLSTVQNQINDTVLPSTHTTPDSIRLQQLLAEMLQAGCTHVFMEVSSHAIHQHRMAGTQLVGACFTNITHDHLDYHQTFDEYIRVKKVLFDELPSTAFALSNADDKRGLVMLQNTKALRKTYSLKSMADFKGKILENQLSGLIMTINGEEVYFRMIGEFNAYNILCVFGAAVLLGEEKSRILQALSMLQGAEGRFDYQLSPKQQIMGIVDYAHTPDALLNVLATIKNLRKANEHIYTIVGCGGNRDSAKRPVMGLVACEHSDKVIFTSDNPRNEDPNEIIRQMESGVAVHQRKKYISISDRREAIKTACAMADAGDIILVAGKGHEKYQEVMGVKNAFDDKEVLTEMFALLEK
ncbi:MAG: hypothetical protein RIQ62_631 [Bacteroidota bacterium]